MVEKIFTRHKVRLPQIFKWKASPEKQKKKKRFMQVIAVFVIAFTFAYFVIQSIKPIMEEECKAMAKSISTKICNNEATEVMKKYEYEDLIVVTKDENGNIKMVGANIITINEIISDIPIRMQEELEKEENNTFNLKLR